MLNRLLNFCGSLKLTIVCLVCAAALVFVGTIAQVDEGLYQAQNRYFRSMLVYWTPSSGLPRFLRTPVLNQMLAKLPAGWKVPVFPGGYLVGAVMLVNLVTAYADRLRQPRHRVGLLMAHGGVILLLIGQFATDLLSVESHMRLTEGQAKDYSEDARKTELAVIETTDKESDLVFPIPEKLLARKEECNLPGLPFRLAVKKYHPNANLFRRTGEAANEPPASSEGIGRGAVLEPAPPVTKMDERNQPAAVVELAAPNGSSLGTWLVALGLEQPQAFSLDKRTFTLQMRPTRYYKPFRLTLLKFTHEKYPGTEIPKDFSSRVRVEQPATHESREALIYMNNPLRYGGETYYQSGYDDRDPRVSILQVVRNPGWLTPYFSCALVFLGLLAHFISRLVEFVRKQMSA
jgi:hypothetical protein